MKAKSLFMPSLLHRGIKEKETLEFRSSSLSYFAELRCKSVKGGVNFNKFVDVVSEWASLYI